MVATVLWACAFAAWVGFFFLVILPWLMGRIPNDERRAYRASPEWHELRATVARRRGYRCAAGHRCAGPLHLHHWTTVSYGYDRPWQLVYLCERHHHSDHRWSAHWWANMISGTNAERWLPVATGLVVGAGKLRRLGRRTPQHATR